MEFVRKLTKFLTKYRYVALILALGLVLMLFPFDSKEEKTEQKETAAASQTDVTEELVKILSQIKGAGKVSVMLTVKTGESVLYQTDEDVSGGSIRQDTVIITDGDRVQSGLVQKVVAPEYRGAIVVCEGADKPEVRLHIIEAVASVTGLGTDKISVLKMK